MQTPEDRAQTNFLGLANNPYPGRGIIQGLDETGLNVIQVYFLMGRSTTSRQRTLEIVDGKLVTKPLPEVTITDPLAVGYTAMTSINEVLFLVTNGDQTDTIVQVAPHHGLGRGFEEALKSRSYEPDPSCTPRIAAAYMRYPDGDFFRMAILRRSRFGKECDRAFYQYEAIAPGFGLMVTTYSGDGKPLPPFVGEPRLMPLLGDLHAIQNAYWGALNDDNKVSMGIRTINIKTGKSEIVTINKYSA